MYSFLSILVNVLSGLAAIVAAWLWRKSTKEEVEYVQPEPEENGSIDGAIVEKSGDRWIDVSKTAKRQSEVSRHAAHAAAIAAILQAISAFLPLFK